MSIQELSEIVCKYFDIPTYYITTKDRRDQIASAKKVICYFARQKYEHKYRHIAKHLNIDHSTVMHHVQSFADLLETNEKYQKYYEDITNKLMVL